MLQFKKSSVCLKFLFNHAWRFFTSEIAGYNIIIVLGDSHLWNYFRILHYISKDVFLLNDAYWVYSYYPTDMDEGLSLSMWNVQNTETDSFTMCSAASTLHSIPWITACFTKRTEKVEYSQFLLSYLNNSNIFVFIEVCTEVGTIEQAAKEAKAMAIIRFSLCYKISCHHVVHSI